MPRALPGLVLASTLLACSSGSSGPGGPGGPAGGPSCPPSTATPASGYPAAHAPFPQVTYQGGGVISSPQIVTVTFPGDTLAAQLQQFGDTLATSCWWEASPAGYCASRGSQCVDYGVVPTTAHVELPMSPGPKYTDSIRGGAATLQTFVAQMVESGALPAPGPSTIYALYFPANVSLELDGQTSCQSFGGYHNSVPVTPPSGPSAGRVMQAPYVVVPRCENQAFLGLFASQLDEVTFSASHELAEASTDPNAGLHRIGFYLADTQDSLPWNLVGGGEIGDLCVDYIGEAEGHPDDQVSTRTTAGTFVTQRLWSSAAAAAGGDPCVPVIPGDTYFNVAIAEGSATVNLSVGQSTTFEATAFSTGPVTWTLLGQDLASLAGMNKVVDVSLSQTSVANGDKVTVTLKLLSTPGPLQPGSNVAGQPYVLISQSGSKYHLWPGVVIAN